ncbi:hypothetical protein MRX96_032235 [Rhipicephalus microplus]
MARPPSPGRRGGRLLARAEGRAGRAREPVGQKEAPRRTVAVPLLPKGLNTSTAPALLSVPPGECAVFAAPGTPAETPGRSWKGRSSATSQHTGGSPPGHVRQSIRLCWERAVLAGCACLLATRDNDQCRGFTESALHDSAVEVRMPPLTDSGN